MGKKKGKGGKDQGGAESLEGTSGGGEGKKSRRKKKEIDEDYDEELAALVNELSGNGVATTIVANTFSTAATTATMATTSAKVATASTTVATTSATVATTPDTAVFTSDTNAGSGSEEKFEPAKMSKKAKKKKKQLDTMEGLKSSEEVTSQMFSQAESNQTEGSGSASVLVQHPSDPGLAVASEDKEMEADIADEQDKKKKKKKKKKLAEEEKKSTKGPGKVALSKIKKLQAAIEEEKIRREQEALAAQKAEEERERDRLEKLRIEKERKERQKQKEKERKLRRKLEGKPVTKKEREAESRRQAHLTALEEQGVSLPEKGSSYNQKKVQYASRAKTKKFRAEEIGAEEFQDEVAAEDGGESSVKASVDSWEDLDSEEEKEEEQEADWEEAEMEDERKNEVDNTVTRTYVKGDQEDNGEEENTSSCTESSSDEDDTLSPFEKAKHRIQSRRLKHDAERSADTLRSPVVCVLGHVDTGKTKILDKIRRTNVQDGEAGGITQQIGATFVPVEAIREQTRMLKEFSKGVLILPGLLIIDTPGHESFSNLRTRGSSMCDLAVLVVDIMHGLEAQTKESLNLLQRGKVPFVIALNKVDRLYDWHRNPSSGIRETLKRQKTNTKDQFDERVKEVTTEFAVEGLNVALFWEKVDSHEYLPMVPTSAITGDGMGDLIALLVEYSIRNLTNQLMLSMEVEALVMEVKVISGLGTTIDVILRNGVMREGDTLVLCGNEGPFVASVRALLMPQPLRELRVKNSYVSHTAVMAAQGIKVTAKGDLEKTLPGTSVLVAKKLDEVDVLKEEAANAMKNALNAIKCQDRGVYVQASTLGSLEALLEFLKQSKIPYSGINIGPVHKRDVMKASIMLEHDSRWAVILAFDVKIERDAQEMADSVGVKMFAADIIYHLFDAFIKHNEELKERNRQQYQSIAVFPCKLRILPDCIFNSRDPIVVGVVVEAGIVKGGTPLTVPSKSFTDIGVVTGLEMNHKAVDICHKGDEVCIKIEPAGGDAPRLYGRHFDHTDLLVSKVSRESIDAVKNYFREDMTKSDWLLMKDLKKQFHIL